MRVGLFRPIRLAPALPPAAIGLGALALFAIALASPQAALAGWLIGFVAVATVALGAVALLAIHALTAGRWGEAARPVLVPAAMILPVLLVGALVLALFAARLYPWAADPARAGPGVARLYLNPGLFALRAVVIFGGLWLFARAGRHRSPGSLAAGLCLVLYALAMNAAGTDWLLSLDPRYTSSAFGMQLIVAQLAAALCVVILVLPGAEADAVWGDFGALLASCLLGELYLILMTFIVHWYGDLPPQAAWYLRRSRHAWIAVEAAGVVFGGVLPLLALMSSAVRRHPARLRVVALAVLAGTVVQWIWLVAPEAGGGLAALGGLAAVLLFGGLGCVLAPWLAPVDGPAWRTADGA